ncbi:MAG: GNAT family N-acetyltransferase [Leptospiraceae bacterium]|nr:GNAT family N-acetyltransferase [Leptospiraceae bacterium]
MTTAPLTIKKITSEEDLNSSFAIRRKVFIEEQKVPESEEYDNWDDLNSNCEHFLLLLSELPIGTGRLRFPNQEGKIERIAILKEYRNKNYGAKLIGFLLKLLKEREISSVYLNSQTSALGFYEKFGFTKEGPEFLDAGIPHYKMTLNLSSSDPT